METTQILIDKYTQLPVNYRNEVMHYVEFLLKKSNKKLQNTQKKEYLSQEQKIELDRRIEQAESGKAKFSTLEEVKNRISEKYGI